MFFSGSRTFPDEFPETYGKGKGGGSIMLTHNGAIIAHTVKKIGATCDSSMEGEGYASSRATELIEFAHQIFRALGNPLLGPTRLYTDNKRSATLNLTIPCLDSASPGS